MIFSMSGRNGTPDPDAAQNAGRWLVPDLEMGALGAAIEDPDARTALVEALTPEDFGRDTHAAVYRVVAEMHRDGRPVDALLLADEMERRGMTFPALRQGGLSGLDALLTDLIEHATIPCNVPAYAAEIRECASRRKLAEVGDSLVSAARAGVASVAEVIEGTEAQFSTITKGRRSRGYTVGAIGSAAFAQARYDRRFLVRGMLVAGQPCIFGGPKKALKTTVGIDLHISLASATDFLGHFRVERPLRSLFLSGESGDATIQETALRICAARSIDLEELDGRAFWGFELPKLSDRRHLDELRRYIAENGIEVVHIDPLYLCLLTGNGRLDAANLFDIGPLLSTIATTCLSAGATPILYHHLRKSRDDPHAPPELEDLAFAGTQEFARQWLMLGRRETYEPGTGEHRLWLVAGGSAGHSGAWAVDVSEGVIGEDFEGRRWRVSVSGATQARREAQDAARDARAEREAEKARAAEERRTRQLIDAAAVALTTLRRLGKATVRTWRAHLRMSGEKFAPVLAHMLEQQQVRECLITIRNGSKGTKNVEGYEPV